MPACILHLLLVGLGVLQCRQEEFESGCWRKVSSGKGSFGTSRSSLGVIVQHDPDSFALMLSLWTPLSGAA